MFLTGKSFARFNCPPYFKEKKARKGLLDYKGQAFCLVCTHTRRLVVVFFLCWAKCNLTSFVFIRLACRNSKLTQILKDSLGIILHTYLGFNACLKSHWLYEVANVGLI